MIPRHLLASVTLCLFVSISQAAGFTFTTIPATPTSPALQAAIWSPCATPAGKIELPRLTLDGIKDCPVSGTQLPLVVISHGYGGSFFDQRDTADALANAGFVVASINHSDDNYQIRGGANDKIGALATRPGDIKRLIDYMLQQWPAHPQLASGKVGFYGFSRGGYTGLVLAGAVPDFHLLPLPPASPCTTEPEGSVCKRIKQNFQELLAMPVQHDSRIRAAVVADPLSMVFNADSLNNVTIPIQLWASAYGGDGVEPQDVAAVRSNLPTAPDWHVADNATHFGFLAPCSAALLKAKPEICTDKPGFDRATFHAAFNAQVAAFFQKSLSSP